MNDIKITILMTVYNGGHFLKMAIESVLAQTYTDFEFLIINDCSTDGSLDVIQSFDDKRIVVHTNEGNIGQTASLNVGLQLAKGKYIARIDADDVAFPNWLEVQDVYLKENPETVVVSANTIVIDENNKILRNFICPISMPDMKFRSIMASPINHGVALIDKEVVLAHGGYDEQHKIIADYGLWSKMIWDGCKFASSNKYLMAIRMHSTRSSIASGNAAYMDEIVNIMFNNIQYISNIDLKREEVKLIYQAYYDTKSLDDQSFVKALKNLGDIYQNLKDEIRDVQKISGVWQRRQLLALLFKRIYFYIGQKEMNKVREVCKVAWSRGVSHVYFNIFYVVSLLGSNVFKMVFPVYQCTQWVNAQLSKGGRDWREIKGGESCKV